jgi:hypothetical protein
VVGGGVHYSTVHREYSNCMYSTNCLSGFYFKLNYTFSFFFETLYLILHQRKHSLYNVISSIVQRVRLRTIFKYASLLCVLYVQEYYRYSTEYVYNTILVLCAYSLCVQREYRVHTRVYAQTTLRSFIT